MRQPLGTKLYYSIGEVSDLTDLQPYTLRAWEKEFPCLRPRRVRGKNRAYRERDIGIILLIKRLLYEERYSTRGVQKKLKSEPDLVRQAADQIDVGRADQPAAPGATQEEALPTPGAEAPEPGRRQALQGGATTPPPSREPEALPADAANRESEGVLKAALLELKGELRDVLRKLS